jgi:hypothetical protein
MVESGAGVSGSGGPAVCARTAPPKLAMSTAATTTAVSPRLHHTRMRPPHPPQTPPGPDRSYAGVKRSPSGSVCTLPSWTSLARWARTDSSAAGWREGSTSA